MNKPLAALVILPLWLVFGCASSNLARDASLQTKIVEGLPVGAAAPTLIARAVWFPNANGAAATSNSPGHTSGMVALSGKNLYFLAWIDDLKAYDTMKVFDLVTARNVRLDGGAAPMVVIEARNLAFDSIELMRAGQVLPDGDAAARLEQLIQEVRARRPAEF